MRANLKEFMCLFLTWSFIRCNYANLNDGSSNIVCYYALQPPGQVDVLQPEQIDPTVCTHIILGFATVTNNSLVPANSYDTETYQKIISLKSKQPNLKVILAAGGGGSAANFPDMVSTSESRASFINQSIPFLHQYGFDGFDLDWEFPAWGSGSKLEDKELFATFLKEFRAAADNFFEDPFLLTLDVASIPPIVDISYDIPEMAKYVDFVNIMCYDYHFFALYDPLTGYNSPLYPKSFEILYLSKLNLAWSANYWVSNGMPKSKINIGIPTYGHSYKLLLSSLNGVYSPTTGAGMFSGTFTYPLVCVFLNSGATEVFDEESQVPYAYHENDWVSYDNIQSIEIKSKWIKANNFSGAMVFDLNCDDWAGICDKNTTFPLHRIIQTTFQSN